MLKISACTIVKNEEKNIQRWMDAVKTFADEIIVVDTGSQDATRELARKAGVKLYYFDWINDFSAAKNFAIEKATGDWLVFLDGDEYFDNESQLNIRNTIKKYHLNEDIIGLIMPCNNVDQDNGDEIISQDWRLRIFRNDKYIRYHGRIHENLRDESNGQVKRNFVIENALHIIHTGYSGKTIHLKLRRNLDILLEEIKEQGMQPHHYFYLQDCYAGLGEYEKAIYFGRLALKHRKDSGLLGSTNSLLCKLLNSIRISKLGDYRYELEKAVKEFYYLPEVNFLYGQYLLAVMHGMQAKKFLSNAVMLQKQPVNALDKIYNRTFYKMPEKAKIYLEKIKKYESYYMAIQNKEYCKAATLAGRDLQVKYKEYSKVAQPLEYLFK